MFIRGQNLRHKDGKTLQLSIHTVRDKFVLFLTVIKEVHEKLVSCNKAYNFLAAKLDEIYRVFGNEL